MTLEEKQQEIVSEFSLFDDWMEKYEYIIDLGKDLPLIDPAKKTDDRLIEGCQSKVWLDAAIEGDKMHLTADSDAIITKGIIGLLVRVLDGESPENVATANLHFIEDIGLAEHLSPTRANGLLSMVKKIKILALTALA
ncbi:MAG: Fe-S metabolism protein SufE [Candidatus Fluviicola riflensis]|nr:MAG: Fe-S metabolism protein SufE [Candidatus Fluviicola riflensis]OGS76613.1 MAG: Fe-S metabolism protein SufE [Candidatus Fluviicola riflensis]OGS83032.1 MAG: Fe-S metabolism protein SufE [Fluviicola sp. RIFCSPHIGHO2_01_FULL_43_53]OGS88344.1 MAG: Fe-S metabolism protein SufE [Fluviicola sp. RIFCSPHIGHO2_12_FULL_43_24]